ncbi:MAG TPA: ATP-binding cassette domain-containing protein [Chloroflexia bacterium]|nr:ATP-binding cassette domain-containing protein [Chloroflexia bacterium]
MTTAVNQNDNKMAQAQASGRRGRRKAWTNGPIILMQDVSKRFGKDKVVVQNISFEINPGQIFCLLGPSGSGKSTTMRMLTGLYRPTEGTVRVFGQEPYKFRKRWRERMGYMPQQFVLFPELSTWGNVNFVASVYGVGWFNRRKKIKRVLEFVDLWDARDKLASQLSGGMQRRLELAATLIHNPELIFVDEPTAGIDPILRAKFWDHFRELRDQGRTLFVTTQYVTEADYCDRVAILNRGRVLALGAPEEIRRNAFGGDIINLSLEFVTTQAVQVLRSIPGIREVQFLNTQDLKLVAEDASVVLPQIIEALRRANLKITTIEQYRPDFEEVFVQLMQQDDSQAEEESEGDLMAQVAHRYASRNRARQQMADQPTGQFATPYQSGNPEGPAQQFVREPVAPAQQNNRPATQPYAETGLPRYEQPRPAPPMPGPEPVPSPHPSGPEPTPVPEPEPGPLPTMPPATPIPDSRYVQSSNQQEPAYAAEEPEVAPRLSELEEQPANPQQAHFQAAESETGSTPRLNDFDEEATLKMPVVNPAERTSQNDYHKEAGK